MFGGLQVLVTHRPEATTALLMQLCTAAEAGEDQWVAQVANFTHLYDERCARSCTLHAQQCLENPRATRRSASAWPEYSCVWLHPCHQLAWAEAG